MKIAIFSDTFPPQVNGVATVAMNSAIQLSRLGHQVHVITVSNGLNNEIRDSRDLPFKIIRLPSIPALVYHDQRISLPLGLGLNRIREIKPDIIHTHTPFGIGIEAVLAAKIFGIPLVGTHHTFYDHYLGHAKLDYEWAKKLSWKAMVGYYNRCDLVISPSKSLADGFMDYGLSAPIRILANPVNTEFFKPINTEDKNILKKNLGIKKLSLIYMGRVSYEKKIDKVIEASSLVLREVPEIGLVIVGDGPDRVSMEKLAKRLGVDKSVSFVGFKFGGDLVKYLQAGDIFVTASDSENMPVSLLEAMATGLPVIGAKALGIPEIVNDGVNGYLFLPDNISELSRKIISLGRDSILLGNMSSAARLSSLKYSQENIAKDLENSYSEMI